MKKLIMLLVLIFTFVGMSIPTFAASQITDPKSDAVYDFEKRADKVFSPTRVETGLSDINAATSTLWWSANVNMYLNLLNGVEAKAWSDSYSNEQMTVRFAIDYIAAEVRMYFNEVLILNNADDHTNSSHAGCMVTDDSFQFGNYDSYGNHSFEEASYTSWYPETFDSSI